jgi:hypothetical protein
LWSSKEDEIETALEIVGLEASPNRGRDLEGRLAERDRGERHNSGRYQTNSLYMSAVFSVKDAGDVLEMA